MQEGEGKGYESGERHETPEGEPDRLLCEGLRSGPAFVALFEDALVGVTSSGLSPHVSVMQPSDAGQRHHLRVKCIVSLSCIGPPPLPGLLNRRDRGLRSSEAVHDEFVRQPSSRRSGRWKPAMSSSHLKNYPALATLLELQGFLPDSRLARGTGPTYVCPCHDQSHTLGLLSLYQGANRTESERELIPQAADPVVHSEVVDQSWPL